MAAFMGIFTFLFSVCHALKPNCPQPEDIAPLCICKDLGNGPMMLCSKALSAQDLIAPIHETESHDMFSLSIHDSSLLYIPSRLFKKTNYKKIRLVGTQLMSLAEEDLAFEGLEETLEEFRVMEAHYMAQWSWSHLRKLQKLQLIDVDLVSLNTIDEPFPPLQSLTALGITRADISFLVENAFQDLKSLRLLVLKNNDISDLSRTMLPYPAEELVVLDLSNNNLNSLPGDFFNGMPSLSDVKLEDNKFVTLNEATFSQILRNAYSVTFRGNNFRCDCRLRWIVNTKTPFEFDAVCSQPENVKGINLKYLTSKNLWC